MPEFYYGVADPDFLVFLGISSTHLKAFNSSIDDAIWNWSWIIKIEDDVKAA
jgi:hypothetical protein